MEPRCVPFSPRVAKRGCGTSPFPFPLPLPPLSHTGPPRTPRYGGVRATPELGTPGLRHGPAGRARLRPAAAHTLDPGLSAGSCVAAEAPVVPLCRARAGPRSPCRRWGRRGAPAAGGGCGALAELRAGRGSVRPPGPRRAWAGRRWSGGAGLALPCPALVPCSGPALARLPRRDHLRPSRDQGPAGQPSSSRARRALVQAWRL